MIVSPMEAKQNALLSAVPSASTTAGGSEPLLVSASSSNDGPIVVPAPVCSRGWWWSLISPLGLLFDRKMQMIIATIIYSGVSQGFIFGDFPPMIADKQWKFFVMAAFGLADVLSSILLGKLSDRVGR